MNIIKTPQIWELCKFCCECKNVAKVDKVILLICLPPFQASQFWLQIVIVTLFLFYFGNKRYYCIVYCIIFHNFFSICCNGSSFFVGRRSSGGKLNTLRPSYSCGLWWMILCLWLSTRRACLSSISTMWWVEFGCANYLIYLNGKNGFYMARLKKIYFVDRLDSASYLSNYSP